MNSDIHTELISTQREKEREEAGKQSAEQVPSCVLTFFFVGGAKQNGKRNENEAQQNETHKRRQRQSQRKV